MKFKIAQYLLIITILSGITGGYFYFQSNAAQKINSSKVNNLTSGLVGYWTFDGADTNTTTATDVSSNDNHGTINGTVTKVPGKLGQALNFDGSTGYLTAGSPNFGASELTECAWIYPNDIVSNQVIMSYANSATQRSFALRISGNLLSAWDMSGNGPYSNTTLTLNTWYHVCVSLSSISGGNAYYAMYINGVNDQGSTTSIYSSSGNDCQAIGTRCNNQAQKFNGRIDEVRVYSRALSQSEITELYQQGQTKINASQDGKLESNLIGYWTFDGADTNIGTNTTNDKSSGGRNGTLSGATKPNPVIGKIGQGMNFNGSTSYVNVAGLTQWYQLPLSYGAWIKLNATPAGDRYVIYKSGEFYLRIGPTSIGCKEDNSGQAETVKTITLVPGQWYHIFCSISSGSKKIYINGTDSSATAGGWGASPYGETLKIGGEPDYNGIFNGQMDEVRIYNKALSASEITELYQQGQTKINASQTGKLTSGLTNYWTFDGPDVSGTTVTDKAGSSNGTLINGPVPAIGKIGQAMEFLGGSDQMTFSGVSLTNTHTVSMWIYPKTSSDDYGCLFSRNDALGLWYRGTNAGANNRKITYFYSSADHHNTTALNDLAWSHVVVVSNAGSVTFYINGQANGTATGALGYDANYMGEDSSNSEEFKGIIDEVRVYNRALSQSEITELYNMGR